MGAVQEDAIPRNPSISRSLSPILWLPTKSQSLVRPPQQVVVCVGVVGTPFFHRGPVTEHSSWVAQFSFLCGGVDWGQVEFLCWWFTSCSYVHLLGLSRVIVYVGNSTNSSYIFTTHIHAPDLFLVSMAHVFKIKFIGNVYNSSPKFNFFT